MYDDYDDDPDDYMPEPREEGFLSNGTWGYYSDERKLAGLMQDAIDEDRQRGEAMKYHPQDAELPDGHLCRGEHHEMLVIVANQRLAKQIAKQPLDFDQPIEEPAAGPRMLTFVLLFGIIFWSGVVLLLHN